jgi:hypothetical protein
LESQEKAAYTKFINALCDIAKRQKRVLATERDIENEKYAMRCFLLRLGFIGEEYAEARQILLRNLSGNGSWKSGGNEKRSKPKPKSENHTKTEKATNPNPTTVEEKPNPSSPIQNLLKKWFSL